MQQTAFQVLKKQAGSASWEFVLFLVLVCAGVHTEAILTIEFCLSAALLTRNWTRKMGYSCLSEP